MGSMGGGGYIFFFIMTQTFKILKNDKEKQILKRTLNENLELLRLSSIFDFKIKIEIKKMHGLVISPPRQI